jgi:GR25 family glycosyltransferase involved in LPS biosynthesis
MKDNLMDIAMNMLKSFQNKIPPKIKWLLIFLIILLIFLWGFNNILFGLFANYRPVVVDNWLVHQVNNSIHTESLKLYYINLERSVDRKNRFLSRLNSNWNPIRVDACSPKTMPKIISPMVCFTITPNEYACLASHLKARHTAYRNGDEYAIIAEDDAIITNDIDWNLLMSTAPSGWDILQLHTCCIPPHLNRTSLSLHSSDEVLWVQTPSIIPSAAFYIVSRSGMYKALNRFIGEDFDKPWDQIKQLDLTPSSVSCHADIALFDNMHRYICTQSFVSTEKGKSTINWAHDTFMFGAQ